MSPWYVESVERGNRNADPGLAARDADSCMQTSHVVRTLTPPTSPQFRQAPVCLTLDDDLVSLTMQHTL